MNETVSEGKGAGDDRQSKNERDRESKTDSYESNDSVREL